MESAVLHALREAIDLKCVVFFDHTLGQFRVGRLAVPPDAVVGLRSIRPDETDGKPYTMAEVYHFLLNINEFPDVYIQKARACGVRPVKGGLRKAVYQEVVGRQRFDPTPWLAASAAAMRMQPMVAAPRRPEVLCRLEDVPMFAPYGSQSSPMGMAATSAATPLYLPPSPSASHGMHVGRIPQHIVDSHPMDVGMAGRPMVYMGPEAAAYPAPSDPFPLSMDAASTSQTTRSFLIMAKTELTTEEYRLFQDVVNQLRRAPTDAEFAALVRKCIRLLGTRWGLVEGLRGFMPAHLKQRYTEIMIEMSVSAHHAEGASAAPAGASTPAPAPTAAAVDAPADPAGAAQAAAALPELKDRLTPKVYQQFQESLQEFYSIRSLAEFDVVAKKWIELLGPGNALIDDLLRSAPAKVKERYAHLLRAAALQPPTVHDGGGRKGRRGSRSSSHEARRKKKHRSASHSKVAAAAEEAEAPPPEKSSASPEEPEVQRAQAAIEAARRRFSDGAAALLAWAAAALPAEGRAALAAGLCAFRGVRTAEQFDAVASKAAELLCGTPELAQSLGRCMPKPLRRRYQQLVSATDPSPAPDGEEADLTSARPLQSPPPTSEANPSPSDGADDPPANLAEFSPLPPLSPLDAELSSPVLADVGATQAPETAMGDGEELREEEERGSTSAEESEPDEGEPGQASEEEGSEEEEEGRGPEEEGERAAEERVEEGREEGGIEAPAGPGVGRLPCSGDGEPQASSSSVSEGAHEEPMTQLPPPLSSDHDADAPAQRFRALVAGILAARPRQCMAIALLTSKLQQEHRREYRRFVQPSPEAYFARHFALVTHGSSVFVRADDTAGSNGRTQCFDSTSAALPSGPFVTPR